MFSHSQHLVNGVAWKPQLHLHTKANWQNKLVVYESHLKEGVRSAVLIFYNAAELCCHHLFVFIPKGFAA